MYERRSTAERIRRFLLLLPLCLALAPLDRCFASQVPAAAQSALASGKSVDLVLQFDDSSIEAEAEAAEIKEKVRSDSARILALKSMRYSEQKERLYGKAPSHDFDVLRDYSHLPMAFVRFHSLAALNALAAQDEFVAAFEDQSVHATQALPNLVQIDEPAALAAGFDGSGVTVAVIDTGVDYTNPAFGACSGPGNPFGCRVAYYQDLCCSDGLLDGNGHGTNVAGIVSEVAPGARIAALKALAANGTGTSTAVLAGINWSIANKVAYNIGAMNLSLGDGSNHPTLCPGSIYAAAFSSAKAAGIVGLAAAGNDGFTAGISDPACVPTAVSVGAVDSFDSVAYFSNSASILTVLAPGVSIYAAGSYYSGTSQATPHAAGAAAVLRARFSQESVDQTISRMTTTGVRLVDWKSGFETPRLDVYDSTLALPTTPAFEPLINFPTGATPYQVATGEFNGDGKADLIVANYGANTMSAMFSHAGGFLPHSDAPVGANPLGIAVGDFDKDGHLDVAIGNHGASTITLLLGHGNGTFSLLAQNNFSTGSVPYGIAAADLDNDGNLDLVTANEGSANVTVLLGVGNGTFLPKVSYATGSDPVFVVVGDFNGDGKPDLAVSNYNSNTLSILLGTGAGKFGAQTTYPVGVNPIGLATSDLDGDGNLDLVVANLSSNTISVLYGKGDGTFKPQIALATGTNPWGVAIADMNGDGWPDIIVTNSSSNNVGVYRGNRYHTFDLPVVFGTAPKPLGVSIADIDGDGKPDIVVATNSANGVSVLLNIADYIFASNFDRKP